MADEIQGLLLEAKEAARLRERVAELEEEARGFVRSLAVKERRIAALVEQNEELRRGAVSLTLEDERELSRGLGVAIELRPKTGGGGYRCSITRRGQAPKVATVEGPIVTSLIQAVLKRNRLVRSAG